MILEGKKVLISGGSSGIGQAISAKLAAAGARVAVADLKPAATNAGNTFSFECDVSSGPALDTLYAAVKEQMGLPDILICSAGQGIHEKLTEGDPAKWQQIINTNLLGALRMVRAFTPHMLEAGQGDVVFISSVAAGQAYPYGGVYAATKAALEVVAETLRQETLPTLRVTVVAPGVTDTPFFENTVSGYHSVADIGYGALPPEAVAEAVLYALGQPPGVSINKLTVRPTGQPF